MKGLRILMLLVCILLLTNISEVSAQCAMCQATVESSLKSGDNTAKGLNNGILYLLAAPYIAIAAIGFLWYKKYRKKNVIIDIEDKKINLN
ncbi:hypothetical protein EIM50_21005 [Pseudoxanthomonas sp. SGD-10]|nr:hypothetical protein EIM50_21005 [Pseudoxanthomonas sp. SGD-10]